MAAMLTAQFLVYDEPFTIQRIFYKIVILYIIKIFVQYYFLFKAYDNLEHV